MTIYMPFVASYENMLICNEAQYSCAVDGIISSCWGKSDDDKASKNCYRAIKNACALPISSKQICELHAIIMKEQMNDTVGKIRNKQFFMHPYYIVNMKEYNPPPPHVVEELLNDLVAFISEDDTVDVLIKTVLAYYQFETIHPFAGGNGRVGRIIPSMILMQQGILTRPMLLLSKYFFDNNAECINWYRRVQFLDDYIGWIKYFVQGIIEAVKMVIKQLEQADMVRRENIGKISAINLAPKTEKLLFRICDHIEQKPIVTIKEISGNFKMAYNTAAKLIDILVDLKILSLVNEQSRYREYFYGKYRDIIF